MRLPRFLGRAQPPRPARPAPFVVGVARSGTTMLRLMLDAHPHLAIPPETAFVPAAAALVGDRDGAAFLDLLTGSPTWTDFHLDEDDVAAGVRALRPFDAGEALRVFYRTYADKRGKQRWGDKTPWYLLHQREIARVLPEAHFVHILRDGRDVAASIGSLPFAPAGGVAASAHEWAHGIRVGREQGAAVDHYMEVRYEALVQEPEPVLRDVCAFLDLPFDGRMLRYFETAGSRMGELTDYRDGTVVMSREARLAAQRMTSAPPSAARIGAWREALDAEAVQQFEQVAGDLLRELGYA